MDPHLTPSRLDLKRDKQLEIDWQDGSKSIYSLSLLRSMCPCATCREHREKEAQRKTLLPILPGNYAGEIRVVNANLVGNYAIQIEWSDNHDTGIYSWQYLREIEPRV
jgi:DUF971 family protein